MTTPSGALSVLVVDDDPFVRRALRALIDGDPGLTTVGEAENGHEATLAVAELRPSVVLMDLEMPVVDGVTASRRIAAAPGAPPIIALTNHLSDRHIGAALQSGAVGYVLKNAHPSQIVEAINTAARGEIALSPEVTRRLVSDYVEKGRREVASTSWADALTDRERDVAQSVAAGMSNQQIAEQLYMSLSTVKSNVSRILTKVGVTNRVQLTLLVHGLEERATRTSRA